MNSGKYSLSFHCENKIIALPTASQNSRLGSITAQASSFPIRLFLPLCFPASNSTGPLLPTGNEMRSKQKEASTNDGC